MNSASTDHHEKAAEARGSTGDKSDAETEPGERCLPGKAAGADPAPDADRTWDIFDWFKIS